MKRGFRLLGAIVVFMVAGGLFTACHHHRHDGHHDPGKMAERLEKHLDHVLDEVDATPQQRENIRPIATQIAEDANQLRSKGVGGHGKILARLLSDTPDRQWLHDQVDQKTKEMNEFAHRTVDRLIEISTVLTPEQCVELKKRLESAHGEKSCSTSRKEAER